MIARYLSFIGDHLWQTTLFVAVVYLLTLVLKGNRAAVRYRLWLAASIKFLLPFAMLISIGRRAEWAADRVETPAAFVSAVEGFSQPFAFGQLSEFQTTPALPENPQSKSETGSPRGVAGRIPMIVFALWLSGALFVFFLWLRA